MGQLRTIAPRAARGAAYVRVARSAALWAAVTLTAGCSDDASSPSQPPPPITTLRVSATTTGPDADSDGYLVWIDDVGRPTDLPPNGTVTFYGLGTGTHVIHVFNIAPNCAIDGGALVVTISSPGISVGSDLHISCTALGEVRVSVSTTGADRDANGYVIAVPGAVGADPATIMVPATGTRSVRVAGGRRIATLHGVAANCDSPDLVPREFDLPMGGSVTLEFAIVCEPVGQLAYSALISPGNSEIFSVRSDGTGTTCLTDDPAADTDPAWSPDGTRIAFTSHRGGVRAVYVMEEDGTNPTRLTPSTSNNSRPAWSPDGSRIAFVSDRDDNLDIYTMNADGSNVTRLTLNDNVGRAPGVVAGREARVRPHPMRPHSGVRGLLPDRLRDGASRASVGSRVGEEPAWSPDGRRMATTGFTCVDSFCYGATCTVTGVGLTTQRRRMSGFPRSSRYVRCVAAR